MNAALQALASISSGANPPSTPYAHQLWADTTSGELKMRNTANTAWVVLGDLDASHLNHLSLDTPQNITAKHSFSPAASDAPFALGSHAQGELVTGLNAEMVGGVKADSLAVRDTARGLVVKNNASNPLHQVDVSADEVLLTDSSNTPLIARGLVGLTADITTSGANGLDTGAEANSTWYYVWVITNSLGDPAGLLSASSTAPTMPSGYTHKALVGAIYNDSSGNLIKMVQRGHAASCEEVQVLTGGTATTPTAIDLSAAVPAIAGKVGGYLRSEHVSTNTRFMVYHYFQNAKVGVQYAENSDSSAFKERQNFSLSVEDQTMHYEVTTGDGTANVFITGWEV